MIIGGGGNPGSTGVAQLAGPGLGVVISGVGPGGPERQRRPVRVVEPAPWSAHHDVDTPFGFCSFDVVPAEPGGTTSITVTRYGAAAGSPSYRPTDRFVLRKPLRPARRLGTRPALAAIAG
jgi:hypothetical protein